MPGVLQPDAVDTAVPSVQDELSPTTLIPPTSPSLIDATAQETALKILEVIGRYRMHTRGTSDREDEGRLKFLAVIYGHVKAGRPVPMCLPAFPFKSPNAVGKVMGKLPDKAEEFSLAHLDGLCLAISNIYPPGAELTIISDGLVYNDLLGVADRDVWAYGEALRELARNKGHSRISFSRLRDLVPIEVPDQLDEMTYVANATNFRRSLLNAFSRPSWDWEEVKKSEDVCLTYCGYIRFLETDLQYVYPLGPDRSKSMYKRGIKYIAQQMLARGEAFARAVQQEYKDHVRLSIHPSTGANKISISLLPTDSAYTTPWHCSVAFRLDGTLMSGPRAGFESDDRYELVHEGDRPSYFRERSDLLSWGEAKGGISCEPLYPSGMLIKPSVPGSMRMDDVDGAKTRALAEVVSPVVLRGFCKTPKKEVFVRKAEEMGRPLPWKFGLVLEVKDAGSNTGGLNNVLSAEWMPFHFDGLFKTKKQINNRGEEVVVPDPPRFQFFTGVTSSPKETGFTLFSSSTLVFRALPAWLTPEVLSCLTWSVSTSSFDQTKMVGLPLVVPHPTTGKPCLRYHEPWPQSKTKFDATDVCIDGLGEEAGRAVCAALDAALHDRRVAYWHAWEKGDMVISDNVLAMHTRSDFNAGCDRELWRIHFD